MKKSEKILAAVLSLTTAVAVSAGAVVADENEVMLISDAQGTVASESTVENENFAPENTPQWYTISGEVTELTDGMIVVKSDTTEIALKASEETVIIDQVTGFPASREEIAIGDYINAQYGPAMTRSIPAQVVADIIIVNADQGTLANLINADDVTMNEDGTVTIYDAMKDIELTVSADSEISPYRTRNIVRLEDITEGSKLVAWYDMVTMSIPAQAYTEKVVLVSVPDEEAAEPEDVAFVSVNGIVVEGEPVIKENTIYVPVRAVAEALGFQVQWNDADFSVALVKDDMNFTIKIGESKMDIGKARSAVEIDAPELIDDKTYVSDVLFTEILGEDSVEIADGIINFKN